MFKNLSLKTALSGLILLIVLLSAAAVVLPEVETAGDAINATGLPLAALFASGGVIILAIMGALIYAVISGVSGGNR